MEPEEIAVVLSRASELQAKLGETIGAFVNDTALRLDHHSSTQNLSAGVNDGAASEEVVRSLATIRDALEVLEEQLEALQVMQQQQRAERDAGLAEIEESRRTLLKRLSEFKGRELEVVQETLAFAGGSVADKEDDKTAGYPNLQEDDPPQLRPVSIAGNIFRPEGQQDRSKALDSEVEEAQDDDEGSDGDLAYQYEAEKDVNSLLEVAVSAADTVRKSGAFTTAVKAVKSCVALLGQLLGNITGQVAGPSSKVVLVVVSTLAVLSLTDLGEKRTKSMSRVSRTPGHRSHHHHTADDLSSNNVQQNGHVKASTGYGHHVKQGSVTDEINAEKALNDTRAVEAEIEYPTCVVRERLELPFYQELQTPDILYGRG